MILTKIKKNIVPLITTLFTIFFVLSVVLVVRKSLFAFQSEAQYQSSQVEKDVQTSVNFVNYMSLVAQNHFDENSQEVNELYYELKYNSSDDIYYLDFDENDENISDVSFLSGTGDIPKSEEVINELNLAFKFNEFFELFYSSTDNVTSIYYLSENDFLSLYPYGNSEITTYTEELHEKEWYMNAVPENNPDRQPVWSSVYVDAFGKGVIVTLSMPIYDGDEFKGVVAVDCTTEGIESIFDSKHDTYLCDSDGSIVASNTSITEGSDEVKNIEELSNDELSNAISSSNVYDEEVLLIDGNFTFALTIENTDWTYVSIVPAGELFIRALFIASPIAFSLAFALFLLVNNKKKLARIKLEAQNERLEEKVNERTRELKLTQEVTIDSVSTLTEFRDNETGNHIYRTKHYAKILTENLGNKEKYRDFITPELVQEIFMSAPLHDIGKVGIRDEILQKPGVLTDEERLEMQEHTIIGYKALLKATEKLGASSFLDCALDLTRHHHEKWDGSGYPDGLAGENIPLSARIMAVADVYDALTSKRVYKPAMTHEKAYEIIVSESGTSFDPEVVEVFETCEVAFKQIAVEYADD